MDSVLLIVDESGRLADWNEDCFVVAVIVADSSVPLSRILRRVHKRLPPKGRRKKERGLSELKFVKVGDKTRRQVLGALAQEDVAIYTLIVDKTGQFIPDTPENYAEAVGYIVQEVVVAYPNVQMVIDRHFSNRAMRQAFNTFLCEKLGRVLEIRHADSVQDSRVNLADFVAGAVWWAERGKSSEFKDIVAGKIVMEKRLVWPSKGKK